MRFSIKSVKSLSSEGSDRSVQTLDTSPPVSIGLTVLYPNGDDSAALVDIITVHGLAGHPQNTWTNFSTQHYWPSKSLPEDIPKSRIMAFGYSTSNSPFHKSTAIISDIAKQLLSHLINKRKSEAQRRRPIIFVAHSLGGIVIKEFLHVASNTGHEPLANCVCGILFLGTPHKGSHLAGFMDVMNGVVKTFARGLPTDLIIKDLSSNSRHLLELDGLLRVKLGKIDIYSFYELLPMAPLKSPVVERHSALLNLPNEIEQIGLDADHRAMCRPVDRNDFIYETIAQRIMSIMNRQLDMTQCSKDLTDMTNAFASRQIEHISVLTKDLHESTAGANMPPTFSSFIQQTLNLHVSDQAALQHDHGLEEILKSLPMHNIKGFMESVQSIMKRASSLTDLLLLVERQNEQRKAEARIALERQANETRIQELMAENARLKEALRQGRTRSPSPLWRSGNNENSTGRHVPMTSDTSNRTKSIPLEERSLSRSRIRTSAIVASEGLRKNELLEVSNADSFLQRTYFDRAGGFNRGAQGYFGHHDMPLIRFDGPVGEEVLGSSGSEPNTFGGVDFSEQPSRKEMKPAKAISGGLVFDNRTHQQTDLLIDQPFNSGFDTSPSSSGWNKSPLFAASDDVSNWPSLFPDTTTATSAVEGEAPQNKRTGEDGDLEHQTSGQRPNTPLPLDAAFNGACLDTGDVITVQEDDKRYGGKHVKNSATGHQAPTLQPIGPQVEPELSRTKTGRPPFVPESSSSIPHIKDDWNAPAKVLIQQLKNNKSKVNSFEESNFAPYEQNPNIELDCAITTAHARRRSPLGIPFRIVKFVFTALRPPTPVIDACRPASLARSSSSMFAKLPFAHSEKKGAKTCEKRETRADKARPDVSGDKTERSSPDEETRTRSHSKRVGMETTAVNLSLATRLRSDAKIKRKEMANQTSEDTNLNVECKLFEGMFASSEGAENVHLESHEHMPGAAPSCSASYPDVHGVQIDARTKFHTTIEPGLTTEPSSHSPLPHGQDSITQSPRENFTSFQNAEELLEFSAQQYEIEKSLLKVHSLLYRLTGLSEVGQRAMLANQSGKETALSADREDELLCEANRSKNHRMEIDGCC